MLRCLATDRNASVTSIDKYRRMRPAASGRVWAIGAFLLTTLVYIGAVVLHFMRGGVIDLNVALLPVTYTFAVVGVLIALRRPGNRIAWLCLGISFGFGLEGFGWEMAIYGMTYPGTVANYEIWAVLGDAAVLPAVYSVMTLLVLLFPDGRPPTPRWAWLGRCSVMLISLAFLVGLVAEEQTAWGRPPVMNPMAISPEPGTFAATLWGLTDLVFVVLLGVSVVGSVVAMVFRYRRSQGVERQQLKWFVTTATFVAILFGGAIFLADYLGDNVGLAAGYLFVLIPISIGIAILRYRLYEIDRLISRTVTYVLVVGLVVGVFAALAIGLPQLLGLPDDNPLPVAVATLAVAALFNPLRRRIQRGVDRRFNRAHYDLEREVSGFTQRLSGRMGMDQLITETVDVVVGTMQPAAVSVWMNPGLTSRSEPVPHVLFGHVDDGEGHGQGAVADRTVTAAGDGG